jgi:hypothetical protein
VRIEIDVPELPPGEWSHCEFRKANPGEFVLHQPEETPTWRQWRDRVPSFFMQVVLVPAKKYREPVLPQDYGKECEFSDDGEHWVYSTLIGWCKEEEDDVLTWINWGGSGYTHARIEVTD